MAPRPAQAPRRLPCLLPAFSPSSHCSPCWVASDCLRAGFQGNYSPLPRRWVVLSTAKGELDLLPLWGKWGMWGGTECYGNTKRSCLEKYLLGVGGRV